MQPIKHLVNWLDQHANSEHYLFTLQDLRALCPDLSNLAFKTLMSRTVRAGYLGRVCRGIYIYKRVTDKLIAFGLRPNRLKYRDLWDMAWLHQQGLKPRIELIPNKLRDRNYTVGYFLRLFNNRKQLLIENGNIALEFKQEMHRFLSIEQIVNPYLRLIGSIKRGTTG